MKNLLPLQNKFQDYLLNLRDDFKKDIVGTERVSTETRLGIYRDAYRIRLHDALAANFPILKIYLGDEQFEELAFDYLAEYPSHFRSIRWFGDHLSPFLSQQEKYKAFPFLSELAQFEWTQTLVFDAKNSEILQLEELGLIPPESWGSMTFELHPSVHRLTFSWNVPPIWQALSDETTPPEPIQTPNTAWILWRQELVTHFCSLSEEEAFGLDALMKGNSFEKICEGLCQWVEEDQAAMKAASLLKGWILAGLIAKVAWVKP